MRYRRDTSGTVNVQRGKKKILNKSRKPQHPLFLRVKLKPNDRGGKVRFGLSWLQTTFFMAASSIIKMCDNNSPNQKHKLQISCLARQVKLFKMSWRKTRPITVQPVMLV